ncbi:MAG: hypothetical protein IJN17_02420 [Clostridia bacterium]|nr:hypothetical protein [Clostridia bacterium]
MKHFARISILAIVVLAVMILAALAVVPASAASSVPTVYIAETAQGKGDGSSAANAMGSVEEILPSVPSATANYEKYTGEDYYKNSALYRAADKIKTTGGKIVLVGDVAIDFTKTAAGEVKDDGTHTSRQTYRDFFMPSHGNRKIIITNGEYSGRLVLTEGAKMNLGGHTVFEDLDIVTHDGTATEANAQKNFAICCCNNTAEFGDGLTVTSYSGNINGTGATKRTANTTNAAYFVNIYGGKRYGIGEGEVDITINSGTWNIVNGGNEGNGGNEQYSDISIRINGGTILGPIAGGGSYNSSIPTFGDVNIHLAGGNYYGNIYAVSRVPLGYGGNTASIKVSGGYFANRNTLNKFYSNTTANVPLTVDLSACTAANSQINNLISGLASDVNIIYPSKWVSSATVKSASDIAFLNEDYGEGFSLNVTYTNGKTGVVNYDPENTKFVVDLDTSTPGQKTMSWACGSASGTKEVNVLNVPQPKFLGSQVGVQTNNLGKMRIVASMSLELGDGVTVNENGTEKPYGFILFVNTPVTDNMDIDMLKIKGATVLEAEVFRSDCDEYGIYNNSKTRTFSAELNNISVKDYASNISIVSYVKFNYNGKQYVRYSDVTDKTVLGVAEAALASGQESATDKAFIQTNIVDKYNAYIADKNAMYDQTSSDAMRTQVVNAFKAMANYQWTPGGTFTLTTGSKTNTYTEGTIYKGIPYVNSSHATLSEFTSYMKTVSGTGGSKNVYIGPIRGVYEIFGTPQYVENGTGSPVYDANGNKTTTTVTVSGGYLTSTSYLSNLTGSATKAPRVITDYISEDYLTISKFFPACDYTAIFNAWNVVGTNEVWPHSIGTALPSANYGVVGVGNYNTAGTNTKTICTTNGTDVMYAAYAACKPGDVLVNMSDSGRSLHMVTGASNGTASASTTLLVSYTTDTMSNNSHFVLDRSVTFQSLYNSGFIPVTIPELKNGLKTPTTVILTDFDVDESFRIGTVQGVIDSNRSIVSVNVKVGIGDKYIYDQTKYYTKQDLDMNKVVLNEFSLVNVHKYMAAGKTYELTVTAEIAGESAPKVLAKESYTKKANDIDRFEVLYTASNLPALALTDDLAQGAIDGMWDQYNSNIWTPSHSFIYTDVDPADTSFCPSSIYLKGTKYKGVLYADMRATTAEFDKTLTADNVFNVPTSLGTNANGYYKVDWSTVMGNHCSASMFHAYQNTSRVSAAYGSRNQPAFKDSGAEDVLRGFAKFIGHTGSATRAYSVYGMYEAVAQWQKGDYMYNTGDGGGHTRMVSEVYVYRNATTGMIDPDKSYVLLCEQTDTLISDRIDTNKYYLYVGTAESGTTYMQFIRSTDTTTPKPTSNYTRYTKFSDFYAKYGFDTTFWLNNKYTFRNLVGESYNAFAYSPLEYITNVGEEKYVGVNRNATLTEFCSPTSSKVPFVVESNYPIVTVLARITNTSTNAVEEIVATRAQTNLHRYDFSTLGTNLNTKLGTLATGSYKIEIIAELASCEVPVLTYTYSK